MIRDDDWLEVIDKGEEKKENKKTSKKEEKEKRIESKDSE